MSTTFNFTGRGNKPAMAPEDQREKSKIWLNVGYTVELTVPDPATGQLMKINRFVSLPFGIGVDTQAPLDVSHIKDVGFKAFQEARNKLLADLQAFGATLQPGEETPVKLELQLRRREEELEPTPIDQNPFMRAISFT